MTPEKLMPALSEYQSTREGKIHNGWNVGIHKGDQYVWVVVSDIAAHLYDRGTSIERLARLVTAMEEAMPWAVSGDPMTELPDEFGSLGEELQAFDNKRYGANYARATGVVAEAIDASEFTKSYTYRGHKIEMRLHQNELYSSLMVQVGIDGQWAPVGFNRYVNALGFAVRRLDEAMLDAAE